MITPSIIEATPNGKQSYDPITGLLKERIVYLSGQVTDDSAYLIISQLLLLDKQSNEPISMYINSPGGSVSAGLGIHDTMKLIKSPVHTMCVGMAASMGAFLLASGEKGYRQATPNSEIMIHQPLGGAQGQASDIIITAKHIEHTRNRLNKLLSEYSGQTVKNMEKLTDRDNYMDSKDACKLGLIDNVVSY